MSFQQFKGIFPEANLSAERGSYKIYILTKRKSYVSNRDASIGFWWTGYDPDTTEIYTLKFIFSHELLQSWRAHVTVPAVHGQI